MVISSLPPPFQKFISHDAFEEIKRRVVVVYVDLPGHETGASELKDGKFPTMQQVRLISEVFVMAF